jgi:hypothetical protein
VGIVVVFLIARRLAGPWAGVLASFLFALLPVVVCMSHEGKPHLPGAVLMLAAVWLAMRYVENGRTRDLVLLSVSCGAAFGMVLSSLPIFVLVPLSEGIRYMRAPRAGHGGRVSWRGLCRASWRVLGGCGLGAAVYFAANPYILINAFVNRAVLASNFGNSMAMYEIDRVLEGLVRVLSLTVEGASLPVVVVGAVAFVLALSVRGRRWGMLPLAVPAGLLFLQFVLLGAGKPAEYGRFGVFPDTALAIAAACGFVALCRRLRFAGATLMVIAIPWTALAGWSYLANFAADVTGAPTSTRTIAADRLRAYWAGASDRVLQIYAEPAPYCCPPIDFAHTRVLLLPRPEDADGERAADALLSARAGPVVYAADGSDRTQPVDDRHVRHTVVHPPWQSPISWANKPLHLWLPMWSPQ